MRCKYFECDREAATNMPCCDSNHGIALRNILQILPKLFDANSDRSYMRDLISIEEVEYYAQLV